MWEYLQLLLTVIMSMHLCGVCTKRTAQQYCRCSEPPVKLCEECEGKHQFSHRLRGNELLPIETFQYYQIPGYVEAFKALSGKQRDEAVEELQKNLKLLKQWKDDLKTTHDNIQEMVSEHWKQQEKELSAFHSSLASAIQAGIREFDSTLIDPNPVLTTGIAKDIRQFQPGTFRLLSTCTDLEAYKRQIIELISKSVFEVEMKPILPDVAPPAAEGRAFRIVGKGTSRSAGKKKSMNAIYLVSAIVCMIGIYISAFSTTQSWAKSLQSLSGKADCTQEYMAQAFCVSTLDWTGSDDMNQAAGSNLTDGWAALDVDRYLRSEREWLNREKALLAKEIDRQVADYVHQVLCYGTQKKQELYQIVQESADSLELFNTTENYEYVLYVKQKANHLKRLNFEFNELQTDNLLDLRRRAGKYQLATRTSPGEFKWDFNGAFDAITFSASRNIELTGVSLTKGMSEGALVLHSLEILKGNTTTGEVLYSDTKKRYMDSDHPFQVDIQLHRNVWITASTQYTIKVLMLGCNGISALKLQSTEQDGLVITPSNTIFNGREKDNLSSVNGGIFYELHYLP